jgi:hypothetical protein
MAGTTKHGPRSRPYAIRPPARSPRPGICNPYRIESYYGPATRGSHVPWQPRARICKSFRLVPALDVFRWARAIRISAGTVSGFDSMHDGYRPIP